MYFGSHMFWPEPVALGPLRFKTLVLKRKHLSNTDREAHGNMNQSIQTVTVGFIPTTHLTLTSAKTRILLFFSAVKRNGCTRKLFWNMSILCPYLSCAHEVSYHCRILLQLSMCYFWRESSSAENLWVPWNQWTLHIWNMDYLDDTKKLWRISPCIGWSSVFSKLGFTRKFHGNRLLC